MKKNKFEETENGRSMIEMLGVLAIIGVLSVGGIAGYSKAMYRYRLNKTIEQITQIAGNVQTFFAPQKNFAGLTSGSESGRNLLKKAKLVPEDMLLDTPINWHGDISYLQHPFDSIFSIGASSSGAGQDDEFSISLYDIPLEACIDILSQDWSNAGFNVAFVNYLYHAEDEFNITFALPLDFAKIVKLCSHDGNDGYVDITLHFADITQGFWPGDLAGGKSYIDSL